MEQPNTQPKNKPTAQFKHGPITGTIWPNQGVNGPFPTMTMQRTYKDQEGNFQRIAAFRQKDLDHCHAVIADMKAHFAAQPAAPVAETAPEAAAPAPDKPAKARKPRKAKAATQAVAQPA